MEGPKQCLDLENKTEEELATLVEELSTYCTERQKLCAKLQQEIDSIQAGIKDVKVKRDALMPKYAERVELEPLIEKSKDMKKTLLNLEGKQKEIEAEEQRVNRKKALREEIKRLKSEKTRLSGNHQALLQNIANIKSQIAELEKQPQNKPSRLTRREADDLLDDLVKQHLPDRFFKSRKKAADNL